MNAREEGRGLSDELDAAGRRIRRLEEAVVARRNDALLAERQVAALQVELGEARREVGELRTMLQRHDLRNEVMRWQLGAARAEADELRAEVARLEAEAERKGGPSH